VGVRLRQEVGRAHERRRSVDGEPAHGLRARRALAQHEADRVHAVGEVVADHREEDEQARRRVQVEGEPDTEAVVR